MLKLKPALMLLLLFIVLSCSQAAFSQGASANASQQSVTPAEIAELVRTNRAILSELRQCRLVIQQATLIQQRSQNLREQISKQEVRVEFIHADLEQVRESIRTSSDATQDEEELKELELSVNAASDAATRAQRSQEYNILKRLQEKNRKQIHQEVERLREREVQLASQLRLEQAKLNEIQGRMEAMEQDLDRLASEAKKQQ